MFKSLFVTTAFSNSFLMILLLYPFSFIKESNSDCDKLKEPVKMDIIKIDNPSKKMINPDFCINYKIMFLCYKLSFRHFSINCLLVAFTKNSFPTFPF